MSLSIAEAITLHSEYDGPQMTYVFDSLSTPGVSKDYGVMIKMLQVRRAGTRLERLLEDIVEAVNRVLSFRNGWNKCRAPVQPTTLGLEAYDFVEGFGGPREAPDRFWDRSRPP